MPQHEDASAIGLQQAKRQLEQGALARPGHAENGHGFTAREPEGDSVEHNLGIEREVNVFEDDDIARGLGPSRAFVL